MAKLSRRSPFTPVIKGARETLADIIKLGLPRDKAERIVGRLFGHTLQDAMELQQNEPVETKKKVRGKRRAEGE